VRVKTWFKLGEIKFNLGHDLFVDFDFRLCPIDFGDFHSENEDFARNEFATSQSSGAVSFVLDVEVAAVSELGQKAKLISIHFN
jgi:hypothetical protein